jgi:hypothetical protein
LIFRNNNAGNEDKVGARRRVYGGGMFKLEPKELANVDASGIAELILDLLVEEKAEQTVMFE